MKVMYVLICILISMKLGKILFIEKLDVIKKIFRVISTYYVLNSNIFIIIIILIRSNKNV